MSRNLKRERKRETPDLLWFPMLSQCVGPHERQRALQLEADAPIKNHTKGPPFKHWCISELVKYALVECAD